LRLEFSRITRGSVVAIALFGFILAAIRVSAGVGDGSATATVRQLLASIGKLRTTTDPAQRNKLNSSINSSLAIDKLSQQALGDQWGKLSPVQRGRFVALVRELLEKIAYPNASQFFSTFTVNFVGEVAKGPERVVKTTVKRSEGGAVSIDYVLDKIDGRWKVVDVILDRQSLAASMASQMQATLKSGSYEDLVAQMKARLAKPVPPASH
jgi:ABC-type transporter MlaC component